MGAAGPDTAMRVLHECEDLRLTGRGPMFATAGEAAGGELTVSFTGIGAGVDVVQAEEFRRLATDGGRSALFVTDKRRSWYNAPGSYERILALSRPWVEAASDLVTMGNSMGGFGAMLFAGPMRARAAVSVTPQASISRRLMPQENRWAEFIDAIDAIRFEDINDCLVDGPVYAVLHGALGKDAYHVEALRPRPGLHHYVFNDDRHDIGAELKGRGLLGPMIDAAVRDDWAGFDALARRGGGVLRAEAGSPVERFEARRTARRNARAENG